MADPSDKEINPMMLSIEQLNSLKGQHEQELQELQKQLDSLATAKAKFANSKNTLSEVSTTDNESSLFVPLTSSLYVPGKLLDPKKVIVELGTGYFADKTTEEAKDMIDRKMTLVQTSVETIEGVGLQKKKNLDVIMQIMTMKMQMAAEKG
jgi:prefoldin alpha subunit